MEIRRSWEDAGSTEAGCSCKRKRNPGDIEVGAFGFEYEEAFGVRPAPDRITIVIPCMQGIALYFRLPGPACSGHVPPPCPATHAH